MTVAVPVGCLEALSRYMLVMTSRRGGGSVDYATERVLVFRRRAAE